MDPDLTQWVPDLLPKRRHNTPDDGCPCPTPRENAAYDRLLDETDPPDDDVDAAPERL